VTVPADRRAVFELPPSGLAMRTRGPARGTVGLRRWGATYVPTNGLDPNVWGVLRVGPDRERARTPIQVTVGGRDEVRVCALLR
jgi:hypothetical protein